MNNPFIGCHTSDRDTEYRIVSDDIDSILIETEFTSWNIGKRIKRLQCIDDIGVGSLIEANEKRKDGSGYNQGKQNEIWILVLIGSEREEYDWNNTEQKTE